MVKVSKTFHTRGLRALLTFRPGVRKTALREVSVDIRPGEVLGILGPNGAGKTTLLRILCGLVTPDAGEVRVQGPVGLVTPGDRSFFWRLTGRENLRFFAALQDAPEADIDAVIHRFGLEEFIDRVYRSYSSGMKKRLAVARALLGDPHVLLLDEATDSLDAASAAELISVVRQRARGTARSVLWATHRVEEVLALCDRVVILVEGQVRFAGALSEFKAILEAGTGTTIELHATRSTPVRALAELHGGEVEASLHSVKWRLPASAGHSSVKGALRALVEAELEVVSLHQEVKPLPLLFAELSDA